MKLTHHSQHPLVFDPKRIYGDSRMPLCKPAGFWLSVDDDWRRWCSENGRFDEMAEFKLASDANVLIIDSVRSLDLFSTAYKRFDRYIVGIDWRLVRVRYQGIIIAPYQWERRMSLDWYYPWDCASGCIWDLRAIKQVADSGTVFAAGSASEQL
jgi:hypothetical protein